jgi:hypothetical protein
MIYFFKSQKSTESLKFLKIKISPFYFRLFISPNQKVGKLREWYFLYKINSIPAIFPLLGCKQTPTTVYHFTYHISDVKKKFRTKLPNDSIE